MGQASFEIERRTFVPESDTIQLFSFVGELAMYNHVFVMFHSCNEAVYVFRENPNQAELYKQLSRYAVDDQCEMYLNLREVSEEDVQAYDVLLQDYFGALNVVPKWLE